MRRNILLLSAGRRVELLNGIKQARDRVAPDAYVIAADMNPAMSAACQVADGSETLPRVSDAGYRDSLVSLCADKEIGLVIPTIDPELLPLAELRETLAAQGTQAVISTPELVFPCRDKRRIAKVFAGLGLGTPAIYPADDIRFPCFSKPIDGSSSQGALRLDSAEDLTPALLGEPNRMFMELVSGHAEFTVDLYYDRHEQLKCVVPRERLETRGGEVSKGVTRRDWLYDYLHIRLGTLAGARGCITLQLFARDADRSIFAIEINPRFGGGYPLTLAAGADYPEWLIREYLLNENIDAFDGWTENLLMLRYDARIVRHLDA